MKTRSPMCYEVWRMQYPQQCTAIYGFPLRCLAFSAFLPTINRKQRAKLALSYAQVAERLPEVTSWEGRF